MTLVQVKKPSTSEIQYPQHDPSSGLVATAAPLLLLRSVFVRNSSPTRCSRNLMGAEGRQESSSTIPVLLL